ncbi:hypothetical protein N9L68_05520 [bacterium]|nr:hypothetical protein [bacterium]
MLGTENPSHMMTNHLPRQPLDKCKGHLNQFHLAGRAKAGFDVQGNKKSDAKPVDALVVFRCGR